MATVKVIENLELRGIRPVGLTFNLIHPNTEYSVPLAMLDSCFGPYGHARTPGGAEAAELVRVCWSDGTSSYCTHRWTKVTRDGQAKRITIFSLNMSPIIQIDRD